jgi:hypothetical protein
MSIEPIIDRGVCLFDESTTQVMVDLICSNIRYKKQDNLPNVILLKLPREFIVSKRFDGLLQRSLASGSAEFNELLRINFNTDGLMPDTFYVHSFLEDLVLPRLEGIGKIAIKHTFDGLIILSAD